MRSWFDRILPPGPLHDWLVEAAWAGAAAAIAALLLLVVRWIAMRALSALLLPLYHRAGKESESSVGRLRTLEGLARNLIHYSLLFVALVTVLGQVGVNLAAILAGAGVVGLALSFGAQRLVRDVLSGVFLLIEDQFRVGESVTLIGSPGMPQLSGRVQGIGLRITRLRDEAGRVITVGNGDVLGVINHSRGEQTAAVEVAVAPETDLEAARAAAGRAGLSEELFAGPAVVDGVTGLGTDKLTLRISAPAQPGRAPEAELALREAVAAAFKEAGLEIR
jgi:small-conductance mechanosensitive channel